MTIVLTGARGQVGSAVRAEAKVRSEQLVAVGRAPDDSGDADAERWIFADLRDPSFAADLPEQADTIVHLAQAPGYRDFPNSALELVDVNVSATARLLDYAMRCGARRFILASTATLYERSHQALAETAPVHCDSFYARTKRAAELLAGGFGEQLHVVSMRLFTVYGGRSTGKLIDNLLARVDEGEPITIEGERGLTLSPVHSSDVARAILDVAGAPDRGPGEETLNVCGPEGLGIREIGSELGAALGRTPVFEELGGEQPAGLVGDGARLAERYAFRPRIGFAEGARMLVAERGAEADAG